MSAEQETDFSFRDGLAYLMLDEALRAYDNTVLARVVEPMLKDAEVAHIGMPILKTPLLALNFVGYMSQELDRGFSVEEATQRSMLKVGGDLLSVSALKKFGKAAARIGLPSVAPVLDAAFLTTRIFSYLGKTRVNANIDATIRMFDENFISPDGGSGDQSTDYLRFAMWNAPGEEVYEDTLFMRRLIDVSTLVTNFHDDFLDGMVTNIRHGFGVILDGARFFLEESASAFSEYIAREIIQDQQRARILRENLVEPAMHYASIITGEVIDATSIYLESEIRQQELLGRALDEHIVRPAYEALRGTYRTLENLVTDFFNSDAANLFQEDERITDIYDRYLQTTSAAITRNLSDLTGATIYEDGKAAYLGIVSDPLQLLPRDTERSSFDFFQPEGRNELSRNLFAIPPDLVRDDLARFNTRRFFEAPPPPSRGLLDRIDAGGFVDEGGNLNYGARLGFDNATVGAGFSVGPDGWKIGATFTTTALSGGQIAAAISTYLFLEGVDVFNTVRKIKKEYPFTKYTPLSDSQLRKRIDDMETYMLKNISSPNLREYFYLSDAQRLQIANLLKAFDKAEHERVNATNRLTRHQQYEERVGSLAKITTRKGKRAKQLEELDVLLSELQSTITATYQSFVEERQQVYADESLATKVFLEPENQILRKAYINELLSQGDLDVAVDQCNLYLNSNPDDKEVLFVRNYSELLSAFQREDHAGVITIANQQLERDVSSEQALMFRADANLAMNRSDLAVEDFKTVLVINPENYQAHLKLGDFHSQKGNYGKANKHYKEALSILNQRGDISEAERQLIDKIEEVSKNIDKRRSERIKSICIEYGIVLLGGLMDYTYFRLTRKTRMSYRLPPMQIPSQFTTQTAMRRFDWASSAVPKNMRL
ncbi:MAG: hypothetical protein JXR42_04875 [Gammaproteobacteria bacterium]|nr:hypothetical protein [Gammaproteobacteria bacterium]